MSTDRDQSGPTSAGPDIHPRVRARLMPAGSWLSYIVLFGSLHISFGTHAGVLAVVPVILTVWRGTLPGVIGGLAAVPTTGLLVVRQTGASLLSGFTTPTLIGAAIDPDGRIIVDRSVGPAGLAWPPSAGAPVLPAQTMETQRARDLIAIEDTETGIISGALTGFVSGNVRAVLGTPVRHSEMLVGLLSFVSSIPRHWSEHERVILRGAADFLVVVLRDADARRRLEDSEPGRGTTFRLHLPVHEEPVGGSDAVVGRVTAS